MSNENIIRVIFYYIDILFRVALSWLIFPGTFLISLGGVMVVITTAHVSIKNIIE